MADTYELYAIRYGHHDRNAAANFIGGDPHDLPMPLDYFVWVIAGAQRVFLFDTGYDQRVADLRGRQLLRPVAEGLKLIGIAADGIEDVILSHLHFDHCGNHDLFPNARYHVQDAEVAYCTGRCMCHPYLRQPYASEDVTNIVAKVFEGRVVFHDGSSDIAPNLSVHRVGGHSRGLQVIRVLTRRGWVVLGSDAAHFYANFEEERPFPLLDSAADMLEGFKTIRKMITSMDHFIPGHDPLVLQRFPAAVTGIDDIVRLDADPIPRGN